MKIQYLGHSSFKLTDSEGDVVTDPFDSKKVGFKFPKVSADIVLSSHDHFDHNFIEGVSGDPFVIDAPGEYEIGGIKVRGFPTFHDDKKGEERGKNTVYVFKIGDYTFCHLGDLGHVLGEEVVEEIGDLAALFVPVGGVYTIGPEEAAKVAAQLEPAYVIPMHYKADGMEDTFDDLAPLSKFLEEMGIEKAESQDELKITKTDLPDETEVVVLKQK